MDVTKRRFMQGLLATMGLALCSDSVARQTAT